MGSFIGSLLGTTKAAKNAAAQQREAGEMARYKPWNVGGSYFGGADYNYEDQTASYNLSPELTQLRDMFMGQTGAPTNTQLDFADSVRDYGSSGITDAFNRDVGGEASQYYSDIQNIMAPGRATEQQQLANNLFSSGRMGQGTALNTGDGYVNPERMEYLTALNRQNEQLAMTAQDRSRSQQAEDIQKGLGYYGTGVQLGQQPYKDAMGMFDLGVQVENMGMSPFNTGIALGGQAQTGNQARATAYGNAASTRQNAALANAGMFTSLLANSMGKDGIDYSKMSNPFANLGGGGGYPYLDSQNRGQNGMDRFGSPYYN